MSRFAQALNVRTGTRLAIEPTHQAVVSWNTFADVGKVRIRLIRGKDAETEWFDYASWSPTERQSFGFKSERSGISLDVDVIRSVDPFDAIDVRAENVDFNLLALASPGKLEPSLPYAQNAMILDVPARSQYVVEDERGWCSPTALSMVNAYHGIDVSVEETARAVFDRAYDGAGNWAFNVAFSGSLGLRAMVAYLRNLDHGERLIERNLPLVLSIAWEPGTLPGAPLERSDGHLVVLRGFTANGDCAVNDPAAPGVRIVYPRGAFERAWRQSDGAAYVVAPGGIDYVSVLAS